MDTIDKMTVEDAYATVKRWGATRGIEDLVIIIGTMGTKFKELDALDHKAYRMVSNDIQKSTSDEDSEGGLVD
jgi:hypothetical protein